MMPDDRLKERVEQWLADTAQPIPAEVVEDILRELPGQGRAWPWTRSSRRWAWPVAVGAAAVLIVGLGLAAKTPFLQALLPGAGGRSPAASVTIMAWDPALDFGLGREARNPAADGFGNLGTWRYLYGETEALDPATFSLMPDFDVGDGAWSVPGLLNLRIYRSGGPTEPEDTIELHPFRTDNEGTKPAILGWTSPISARVSVHAAFVLRQVCDVPADGVLVHLAHDAASIWSAEIPALQQATYDGTMTVERGESLYVVVSPGEDSSCDTTTLTLRVSTVP
jgi:hypothetical protein